MRIVISDYAAQMLTEAARIQAELDESVEGDPAFIPDNPHSMMYEVWWPMSSLRWAAVRDGIIITRWNLFTGEVNDG